MTISQPAPQTHSFTVTDLEVFPEDGNRYEVIEGELYVTHAPDLRHQAALDHLTTALATWQAAAAGRGFAVSGAGVVFAFDTGVIPDLLWVSEERLAAIVIDPATGQPGGRFYQAPDLLVEIVSPGVDNERRDREVKLKLYARRGAREYWIVDYQRQAVEVYRRTPTATLELVATLGAADRLISPLLPAFALPVERIFGLPPGLATVLTSPRA
jgi:Uma2 family endonuclease